MLVAFPRRESLRWLRHPHPVGKHPRGGILGVGAATEKGVEVGVGIRRARPGEVGPVQDPGVPSKAVVLLEVVSRQGRLLESSLAASSFLRLWCLLSSGIIAGVCGELRPQPRRSRHRIGELMGAGPGVVNTKHRWHRHQVPRLHRCLRLSISMPRRQISPRWEGRK